MSASSPMPAAVPNFVDVDGLRVVPHAEWNALVERVGGGTADTYLRLGYHVASEQLEPGAVAHPVLLHVQDVAGEWLLPLLVRPLPNGEAGFDATSAYGYGGPIATGTPDLAAAGAALDAWALANGIVATFLRFHPLLDNARLAPPRAEIVELGATVAWEIGDGERDLLADMHTHHRRAVRKADRAGLEIVITEAPTDLAAFRELYDTTMRRQDAEEFYFFAGAYWQALIDEPDVELVLVDGMLEGEVIASLLCYRAGDALHYHLGASADAARNIGASNRCFLAAAQWGQERGIAQLHLGGGYGGGTDSPLFVFKHRYDPASEPHAFAIGKLVHDAERFRALAGTDSTAGFFPPWRG